MGAMGCVEWDEYTRNTQLMLKNYMFKFTF